MPSKGDRYNKIDPYVECKQYCKENTLEIKCKGLCGTHTVSVFKTRDEKQYHKDDFCKGFYWNCPIYQGIEMD